MRCSKRCDIASTYLRSPVPAVTRLTRGHVAVTAPSLVRGAVIGRAPDSLSSPPPHPTPAPPPPRKAPSSLSL